VVLDDAELVDVDDDGGVLVGVDETGWGGVTRAATAA
jgi:hypothetical protein